LGLYIAKKPIKMIAMLMALADLLTPQVYFGFNNTFRVKNTSITFCEKWGDNRWSVEAFNDHRHLG